MTLTITESGTFALKGDILFDNAFAVEQQGYEQLSPSLKACSGHIEISLLALGQTDSSALSVFLSWIRLARQHQVRLCFTNTPKELHGIAQVCGISSMLESVSCSSSS